MARSRAFNLTAEINLRGPANIGNVVSNIRRQLTGITVDITPRINAQAMRSVTTLNTNLQTLNRTFQQTQTSVTGATAAIRNFGQAINSIGNASRTITQTAAATQNLTQRANTAATGIGGASTQMTEFGRQSAIAVRRFAAFSLVTSAIYSFTGALSQGIKAFLDFDKEFVRLQQVTGQSAAGLKDLSKQISSLSSSLGVSSSELTTVAVTLAQAGLSARDTEKALKALALSSLAPSFDDMNQTVEGSIAIMRQFGIGAGDLESALGSINAVAAQFAVEASDLIVAIQRTGGVFATASKGVSEGKDALNEFLAVFTSIRATTRESAETIATGLRTIFTRLQRASTVDALKALGIELRDVEGKFVGPYEAVRRLSEGLSKIDPRSAEFAKISEELGGFRQVGKVIPLIQQFAVAQNALGVAQKGSGSLAKDAGTAQLALANQIAKVREEFLALVRSIGESESFRSMISIALQFASALIKIADAVKIVLPALTAMAAFKGLQALTQFGAGFMGGIRGGGARHANGGYIRGYASGGLVPGSGDGDTVPAMLTPGEFVIRKKAVQAIGASNLHAVNGYASGGRVKKFTRGGIANAPMIDDILQTTGSVLPKSSAVQALIKAGGGAVDIDRTLKRTIGDKAYSKASTVGAQKSVLNRFFTDEAARLQDIKSSPLTGFGKSLQEAIQSGQLKGNKISIISKSQRTKGVPEYLSQLFGIPVQNMVFTQGGSKQPAMDAIRSKGPRIERVGRHSYASGGIIPKRFDVGGGPTKVDVQDVNNQLATVRKEGPFASPGRPGKTSSTGLGTITSAAQQFINMPDNTPSLFGAAFLSPQGGISDLNGQLEPGVIASVVKKTKAYQALSVAGRGIGPKNPAYAEAQAAQKSLEAVMDAAEQKSAFKVIAESLSEPTATNIENIILSKVMDAVEEGGGILSSKIGTGTRISAGGHSAAAKILKQSNIDTVIGNVFEAMVTNAGAPYSDLDRDTANDPWDFPGGLGSTAKNFGNGRLSNIITDTKTRFTGSNIASLMTKVKNYEGKILIGQIESVLNQPGIKAVFSTQKLNKQDIVPIYKYKDWQEQQMKKRATGGSISRFAVGGQAQAIASQMKKGSPIANSWWTGTFAGNNILFDWSRPTKAFKIPTGEDIEIDMGFRKLLIDKAQREWMSFQDKNKKGLKQLSPEERAKLAAVTAMTPEAIAKIEKDAEVRKAQAEIKRTSGFRGDVEDRGLKRSGLNLRRYASGGSSEDTVPALLTPGEFVINKNAASRLGSATLHKLNNADKISGFNKGGSVGFIQRFAGGADVLGLNPRDAVRIKAAVGNNADLLDKFGKAVAGWPVANVGNALKVLTRSLEKGASEAEALAKATSGVVGSATKTSKPVVKDNGMPDTRPTIPGFGGPPVTQQALADRYARQQDLKSRLLSTQNQSGGQVQLSQKGDAFAMSMSNRPSTNFPTFNKMGMGKVGSSIKSVGSSLFSGQMIQDPSGPAGQMMKKGLFRRSGGTGMAGMALTMVGGAAVEGAASLAGGEKTATGRAISNVGGDIANYAAMGAMLGSMIPGVGTALGGLAGAAVGAVTGMMKLEKANREAAESAQRNKTEASREVSGKNIQAYSTIAGQAGATADQRNQARSNAVGGLKPTRMDEQNLEDIISKKHAYESGPGFFGQRKGAAQRAADEQTTKEISEARKGTAQQSEQILATDMISAGKSFKQLQSSMNKTSEGQEQFRTLTEDIASADKEYIAYKRSQNKQIAKLRSAGRDEEANSLQASVNETLDAMRVRIAERELSEENAKVAADNFAKDQEKLSKALNRATVSLLKSFDAIDQSFNRTAMVIGQLGNKRSEIVSGKKSLTSNQFAERADVFKNPLAYSREERQGAINQTKGMFGPIGDVIDNTINAVEDARNAALTKGGNDTKGRQDAKQSLLESVKNSAGAFGGLGPVLEANIEQAFSNAKPEDTLDDIIEKALGPAGEIGQKAMGLFAKANEEAAKALGELAATAQEWGNIQSRINSRTSSLRGMQAQNKLQETESLGIKVSNQDKFNASIAGLSGTMRGVAGGRMDQILSARQEIQARQTRLAGNVANAEQNAIAGTPGANDQLINLQKNLARTNAEIEKFDQELEQMPQIIEQSLNNVFNQMQKRVSMLEARKQAGAGFAEKLVTSTPQELNDLNSTYAVLNNTLKGNITTIKDSKVAQEAYFKALREGRNPQEAMNEAQGAFANENKKALSMFNELAQVAGVQGPEMDMMRADLIENMAASNGQRNNPLIQNILGQLRQSPEERAKNDPVLIALQGQAESLRQAQVEAVNAANEIDRNKQAELLAQVSQKILEAFTNVASMINSALQGVAQATGSVVLGSQQNGTTTPQTNTNNPPTPAPQKPNAPSVSVHPQTGQPLTPGQQAMIELGLPLPPVAGAAPAAGGAPAPAAGGAPAPAAGGAPAPMNLAPINEAARVNDEAGRMMSGSRRAAVGAQEEIAGRRQGDIDEFNRQRDAMAQTNPNSVRGRQQRAQHERFINDTARATRFDSDQARRTALKEQNDKRKAQAQYTYKNRRAIMAGLMDPNKEAQEQKDRDRREGQAQAQQPMGGRGGAGGAQGAAGAPAGVGAGGGQAPAVGGPAAPPAAAGGGQNLPDMQQFINQLAASITNFGGYVNQLSKINLPSKLTINHNGKVEVLITGAEAMKGLEKGFQNMIETKIVEVMESKGVVTDPEKVKHGKPAR